MTPRARKTDWLTLWRTASPESLAAGRLGKDLAAFLAARTEPASERQRSLLAGVLRDEEDAATSAFALAGLLLPWDQRLTDLSMSWVLVAALAGFQPAVLALAQALGAMARKDGSGPASPRVLRLAAAWGSRLTGNALVEPGRWADAFAGLRIEPARPASRPAPPARALPLPNGEARLVVVREIGDAKSKEGKDMVKAYGDLTRPLPLVGGDVDPEAFQGAMLAEFPNMADAIARITDDLRLRRGAGVPWARFRPLLLVGPAGIGKTRFAKRVARLLGSGYGEVPAGGASDNRMLAGTARGWSTAQPALPLLVMHRSQTANPVILVDEIDKAGGSERNGDLRATLLGLLETETARAWSDEALLAPCDLSQISWILTANRAEPIAGPLLGRVAVISVRRPPASAFDTILAAILRDLAAELAVETAMLPELDDQAVETLRMAFVKGAPVRLLKAAITRALAASETVRVLN